MNLLFNSEIVNLLLETNGGWVGREPTFSFFFFFVVWSALIVGGRWLHGAESPA